MEAKRGYVISDIYQGGYSSLTPPDNAYITAGSLGITSSPFTPNVIQEVSTKLSSGVKTIEVSAIKPEIFNAIPKQQLKEVNRLAKLTGVDITLHAPLVEASGIGEQGFNEAERESAEKKIAHSLLRSHDLNPDGNIPVTFHSSSGIPGSQFLPPSQRKEDDKYKRLIIVNRETGKLGPLEHEKKFYPEEENLEKGVIYSPEENLKIVNKTEWNNSINQLIFSKDRVDQILEENRVLIEPILTDYAAGRIEDIKNLKSPTQQQALMRVRLAKDYLDDVYKQVNSIFSKAYEFGTEEQKNELQKLSESLKKDLEENNLPIYGQSKAMDNFIHQLKRPLFAPDMYVPIEDFAVKKSSESFGNAAWQTYKDLKGKNVPILSIENPPAGGGLSTGEDIKNIVKASREKFVENAVKEGLSKSQAEAEAEKLIGATWDVGHINMLRGKGYSEKEIAEEAKHVAPYVKHIHLSDNFGFEHTELPMGMGNVPIKEIMKNLGQKGYDAKKIIEASDWWQHFKTQPFQETLEAFGSPIYGMKMAPYWSQASGLYQGYFSGYGQMLPQINYETFGAGFSRLPAELGGQTPGTQGSRMSGRGME